MRVASPSGGTWDRPGRGGLVRVDGLGGGWLGSDRLGRSSLVQVSHRGLTRFRATGRRGRPQDEEVVRVMREVKRKGLYNIREIPASVTDTL